MSSVKDYAAEIRRGYTTAMNRLQKKYDSLVGALDEEYDSRNREISRNTLNSKNSASANHKLGLANAQRRLLEKGLESSGESVNTEIRSNIAKNNDFALLDAEAEHAREQNALSRAREKSKLISSRLEEESALEESMNKALREQYNLDREYEADRADAEEDKRRWESESAEDKRRWESESAEDKRRWESETAEDKRRWESESSEDKRRWETETANDKAEAEEKARLERDKLNAEIADNYAKNSLAERELEADEEQRLYENSVTERKLISEGVGGGGNTASASAKDTGVYPEYDAHTLVDTIFKYHNSKNYRDKRDRYAAIEKAIYKILNDTTLSRSYKVQVRVYATAMGYI